MGSTSQEVDEIEVLDPPLSEVDDNPPIENIGIDKNLNLMDEMEYLEHGGLETETSKELHFSEY